jgi:hypothetical protein
MDFSQADLFLYLSLILAATLYSSVGHGGASGYLAVMVLFGLAPEVMRPVALCMNIVVTSWLLFRHRKDIANIVRFSPLILAAIPAAFIGGAWKIESTTYKLLVGVILFIAAIRMFWPTVKESDENPLSRFGLVASGGSLGLLAGLTGVGGGIFLSPFLVMMGWSSVKKSIVPVAAFIWFNSIAGLSGFMVNGGAIPNNTLIMVAVAFIGGLIGAEISLREHYKHLLGYLLGIVLLIASIKMIGLSF